MSTPRRPTLTRDQVVEAALGLLRDDGLDALTMRRLAAALDVQAPALYWHVRDKQELLDAMADAVTLATGMGPPEPGETWQEWLRRRAIGYRAAISRYRDGARLVANARLRPVTIAAFETELAALVAAGFTPLLAMSTIATLTHYIHGFVLQEQTTRAPDPPDLLAAMVAEIPGGFDSTFVRAATAGVAGGRDAAFRHGVDVIVKGTERLLGG